MTKGLTDTYVATTYCDLSTKRSVRICAGGIQPGVEELRKFSLKREGGGQLEEESGKTGRRWWGTEDKGNSTHMWNPCAGQNERVFGKLMNLISRNVGTRFFIGSTC